ncbi:hypothetical protein [Mucilaginibacter arboris]|uniref:Uncharacterized protein n=1 Tax=Mucilaginibacter arboris TaxID=2682090 RepID=A0A7K1T0W2_9SPHI|nr:hypothetical protein [Mucilaginibacter arboris]MVN23204.1 hypothetical protein [Mucilaginibacter arboris]
MKQARKNEKIASEFTGDKGSFSAGFLETEFNDFTNGYSTFTVLKIQLKRLQDVCKQRS